MVTLIRQGIRWRPRRLPSVSPMSAAERVLSAASAIEPDRARCLAWYAEDPIRAFGDRTADQVVRAGETSQLIAMINGIRGMERRR